MLLHLRAAFVIPPARFPEFSARLRVKPNSHSTGRITPRVLLPRGLIRLSPRRSHSRLLISSDQAASTSGSQTGSSVSISKPAKVARSRAGNCAASRKTSLRLRSITDSVLRGETEFNPAIPPEKQDVQSQEKHARHQCHTIIALL